MKNRVSFKKPAAYLTALLFVFPAASQAVNFYDGTRAPDGLYFLSYTSLYSADKLNGADGKTSKSGYGYSKAEELLRLCYYNSGAVLTAFVPAGYAKSDYYSRDSGGLGDVSLGAGYFLPVKSMDILPMAIVKFPTGKYDAAKRVNYGSNQYDIRTAVFFYKALGNLSVDAAAKYFFRAKNPDTGTAPGDEWYLQCLLGWSPTQKLKFGPSVNWMKSGPQKRDGGKVAASERESFSLGTDIYYRFSAISVTFTYLGDLRAKNTTKGNFFQLKTCRKF